MNKKYLNSRQSSICLLLIISTNDYDKLSKDIKAISNQWKGVSKSLKIKKQEAVTIAWYQY